MGLPRAFVGFSSTDIHYYRLMTAWKANAKMDFNFADVQLEQELDSENEEYIKRKCRERIGLASRFIMLIGQDTRSKHKYVRWEADVAIEKNCIIIGVNLDGSRQINHNTCPPIIRDIGAMFIPFSPKIVAHALENYATPGDSKNYEYKASVYRQLGYE
jgi:hypothetical protein